MVGLIWFPLPEGDQKGRTFKNVVPEDIFLGDNLYAEGLPRLLCAEVRCDIVSEATVVCDYAGAVVCEQYGGSGDSGFDFQLLMSICRYINRQHHVGMLKALSNGALELRRPTVFPEVS